MLYQLGVNLTNVTNSVNLESATYRQCYDKAGSIPTDRPTVFSITYSKRIFMGYLEMCGNKRTIVHAHGEVLRQERP
jgi:hypothetical protein